MTEQLSINGTKFVVDDDLRELETAISGSTVYLEVWLTRAEGETLAALVNEKSAFLIWMTPDCPEGWHSLSQEYPLESPAYLPFRLANGQVDEFPEDYCIARLKALGVLRKFWKTGLRPASVEWVYDSA